MKQSAAKRTTIILTEKNRQDIAVICGHWGIATASGTIKFALRETARRAKTAK